MATRTRQDSRGGPRQSRPARLPIDTGDFVTALRSLGREEPGLFAHWQRTLEAKHQRWIAFERREARRPAPGRP